jgi:acetate kinase
VSGVLVVNAGSTSLKLSVVDRDGRATRAASLAEAPADLDGVVHRVVHGGPHFRRPVVVDDEVLKQLQDLVELAPLHNRAALDALAEARAALPHVPHVAVFDTAFHATIPEVASVYAVPARWRDEWAVRRYGFHGLSVEWAAGRVPVARLVVCHLGGGCSVTAVLDGRSVETTMGFSPLEGVPMATRSGSIDAEVVLHLLRTGKRQAEEIEHDLEHESGLFGLSGVSARVEELESLGTRDAEGALAVFAYRVALAVCTMAGALGGVDAVVFTGGVGEGSSRVRRDVCSRLGFLGVALDDEANTTAQTETAVDVQAEHSRQRVVVVHAREDIVAARAAFALLPGTGSRTGR